MNTVGQRMRYVERCIICCTGLYLRMLPSTTSGKIPAQLGELSKLEKLDLWDNFIEGEPLLSRKQRFARRSFWRNIRETGSVHASERKVDRHQRVRKVRSILRNLSSC